MKQLSRKAAALLAAIVVTGPAAAASKESPVQLITLDPGHFHAALVQKFMLPDVSPKVLVFAPEGDDVVQHLKRVEGFNKRAENPTTWETTVYTGPDYLKRALFATLGGNSPPGLPNVPHGVRGGAVGQQRAQE